MKKVGKTTGKFRDDLNQIHYNYTVEVTNRFKGMDLVDRVPEELWTEVCDIVQEALINSIPNKKKCKKVKWLSEEALQIAEKRRDAKREKRKGIYPSECGVPKNSTSSNGGFPKKAFLSEQWKEIEENNRMGKTTNL